MSLFSLWLILLVLGFVVALFSLPAGEFFIGGAFGIGLSQALCRPENGQKRV